MINSDDLRAAGAARRAAYEERTLPGIGAMRSGAPSGHVHRALAARGEEGMGGGTVRREVAFPAQYTKRMVERDGKPWNEVSGYATAYERSYEMWDMFGPYEEHVARGAATATLEAKPDVVFLVNHTGLAMARTTSGGSLVLSEDDHGLADTAYLNPDRQDVRDLVAAIDDGIVTEQSFAFRIDEAWWNDDFTEFKIVQFDLNRGDVSAVNYGANPHTDITARQRTILRELAAAPAHIQRAAQVALQPSVAEAIIDNYLDMAEKRSEPTKGGSTSLWGAILGTWEQDVA